MVCLAEKGRRGPTRKPDHEVKPHAHYVRRWRDQAREKRAYHREKEDLTEAPGLKPALTGDYHKCGRPNPTAEQLWTWAQEIEHAIKHNFWGKKGRPATEPMSHVGWDTRWLHRHVFPAPPLPHTTNRRGDANCA